MNNRDDQEVRHLNKELDEAYVRGDTVAMKRIFADDLSFTSPRGLVSNKMQALAFLESGDIKYESYESDDINVRLYEDTAVVTGRLTRKGRVKEQDISGQFRYTRVYLKRQGQWQLVAVQVTTIAEDTRIAKETRIAGGWFSDLYLILDKLGLPEKPSSNFCHQKG
jgi:ketosteroid isomerase-like protein